MRIVCLIVSAAVFALVGCDKKNNFLGPGTSLLYDNGPFITHSGGGYNGADASALHDGLSTYGFNCYLTPTIYKLTDEFTVTDTNGWYISEMIFYCYMTNSDTISPITGFYVQIWNGRPDSAGSAVVWGNPDTNVLTSSVWTRCYRTSSTTIATAYTRPIMANTCSIQHSFPAGTYWVEFSVAGSGGTAGPYAPPVTILTQTTTGNARQHNGTIWQALLDSGTSAAQGFPFLVFGYAQ